MGSPAAKPLRASVYNLDERATKALRLIFLSTHKNGCILTKEESANVSIFLLLLRTNTIPVLELDARHRQDVSMLLEALLFLLIPVRLHKLMTYRMAKKNSYCRRYSKCK